MPYIVENDVDSYGFLSGAWPFGVVEGIWTFIALRRPLQSFRIAIASSIPPRIASLRWKTCMRTRGW